MDRQTHQDGQHLGFNRCRVVRCMLGYRHQPHPTYTTHSMHFVLLSVPLSFMNQTQSHFVFCQKQDAEQDLVVPLARMLTGTMTTLLSRKWKTMLMLQSYCILPPSTIQEFSLQVRAHQPFLNRAIRNGY